MEKVTTVEQLTAMVGRTIKVSQWVAIDQASRLARYAATNRLIRPRWMGTRRATTKATSAMST